MALTLGSTGEEVRKRQQLLRDAGYDIAVDGILGRQTMAAWNDYQKSRQPANDKLAQAWEKARQQALGAGVSPENIDPAYVQALASGTTGAYTGAAVAMGQAQRPVFATQQTTFQPFTYQGQPRMSLAEAMAQARATLGPAYEQDVQRQAQRIGYDLLRRGGYGQPDSPEIVQQGIAPTQANYLSSVAALANQLYLAAQQAAAQERQQAFSEWQAGTSLGLTREQMAQQAAQQTAERQLAAQKWAWQQEQDRLANALARAQLEWQRQYQGGQLELQRARLTQPEQITAKEQYTSTLYNKLLSGQPLTDLEKAVLGIRESDPYQSAVTLAQKDPNWLYADTDEKKQALIDFYYRRLTGQTAASPAQPNPLEDIRAEGMLKK